MHRYQNHRSIWEKMAWAGLLHLAGYCVNLESMVGSVRHSASTATTAVPRRNHDMSDDRNHRPDQPRRRKCGANERSHDVIADGRKLDVIAIVFRGPSASISPPPFVPPLPITTPFGVTTPFSICNSSATMTDPASFAITADPTLASSLVGSPAPLLTFGSTVAVLDFSDATVPSGATAPGMSTHIYCAPASVTTCAGTSVMDTSSLAMPSKIGATAMIGMSSPSGC